MGSIFKSQPSTPAPPPPPPPSTYRDEIGGTEQVPVKNPDGTYTYITRKLPLTDEQKAEQEAYDKIMKDALAEIQKLSSTDYDHDPQTQKVLDAWEAESQSILQETFEERSDEEDKILARRGLSSSSAGEAARRRRLVDKQEAQSQLNREKNLLADDVRHEKLALQQNLYNIASNRQDVEQARALSSATSGMSAVSSINAGNRASIADYYSRQLKQQNSKLQNGVGLFGNVLGQTMGVPAQTLGSVLKIF